MAQHSSVAVLVTCFNQERYIRQALDSIKTQTRPAEQVIVVDGGSSDRSVAVIDDWIQENNYPIEFLRQAENLGVAADLDLAMRHVQTEYVCTVYGDDWITPDRLQIQVPLLAASDDTVALVVGSMREVDRYGETILDHDFTDRVLPFATMDSAARLLQLVRENTIPSPAVMLKSDAVRSVGSYDTTLSFDDYDLWLRLLERYTLIFDPRIVVNYRLLAGSLSRSKQGQGRFLLSEARMLFKHRGVNGEIDSAIVERLRRSEESLLANNDRSRVAEIRALLAEMS